MAFLNDVANTIKNPLNKRVNAKFTDPDDPVLDIQELSGLKRHVTLRGNRLPKDKIPVGGKQRITKTYYPGHPEPTVQILGPEEDDLVIEGMLKDRRIPIEYKGESLLLMEVLDSVRAYGSMLLVEWASYRRYCYLQEAKFEIERENRITYKLTFSIYGLSPETICKAKTTRNEFTMVQLAKEFGQALQKAQIPDTIPQSLGDAIKGLVSDVAKPLNDIFGVVDAVSGAVTDLVSVAPRLAGLIKNVNTKLRQLELKIMQIKHVALHSKRNVSETWKNLTSMRSMSSIARSIRYFLKDLSRLLRSITEQIPIGRHKVIDGDTLQKIAVKFYKDAGQWAKIKDHNKLPSVDLVPGKILEIPR
jgi:hypothetical protein